MGDRVKWITHKGVKMIYADYSGLPEAEYCSTMDEVTALLRSESSDSLALVMANVSNTHASNKVRDKGKEVAEAMDRFKGSAYAVVGVTGIMKVVAKTFVRSIHFADNEEAAKDYLVKQSQQGK
jgi:2',3'-cyclic-nucleotide 2'-phosphodiesterase (5'-nucleotidase family)